MLLSLLRSQHASLRSKAAELVATCVQNNPPVQQVCALLVRHEVCNAEACLQMCVGLRPEGAMSRRACLPAPTAYTSSCTPYRKDGPPACM